MMSASKLNQLTDEVKKILNVLHLEPDLGLGEMGVDSIVIIEVILACESIYGCHIAPDSLAIDQYTSIRDLDRMFSEEAAKTAHHDKVPS